MKIFSLGRKFPYNRPVNSKESRNHNQRMAMFSPGQLNQILPQGSLQKPSEDDTMVKISEMTINQPEETIKSSLKC